MLLKPPRRPQAFLSPAGRIDESERPVAVVDCDSERSLMKIDLEKFKGTLPYASELFGIYQPLLGWKSKMTEDRFNRSRDSLFRSLSTRAISRARSDLDVQAAHERFTVIGKLEVLDVVSTRYIPRVTTEI